MKFQVLLAFILLANIFIIKADSIDVYYNQKIHDSLKVKYVSQYIVSISSYKNYSNLGDYKKIIPIAERLSDKIHLANLYSAIGNYYRYARQWDSARYYLTEALIGYKLLNNTLKIGRRYMDIGLTYYGSNKPDSAFSYYYKAVSIFEDTDNKELLAKAKGNIANAFTYKHDYANALKFQKEIMKVFTELGDSSNIAAAALNAGISSYELDKVKEAEQYYLKSLQIAEVINNKHILSMATNNLGVLYQNNGEYDRATKYLEYALKIVKETGEIDLYSSNCNNLALIKIKTGKPREAFPLLDEALVLAGKEKMLHLLMEIYYTYSLAYRATGNLKEAIEALDKFGAYKDSVLNLESAEQLSKMTGELENSRKEHEIELQKATIEKQNAEVNRQIILKYFFIVGFLLMIIIAVVLFRSYHLKRKSNRIISEQKESVELKNQLLNQKNKEITDSLNYARDIQEALLSSDEYLGKVFPGFYKVFIPRDIVSGDFYWVYQNQSGDIILCVADCTGHGVPGAFMSMLGISLLNEIVIDDDIYSPAEIMNRLRERIIKTFEKTKRKDGMDMSICLFDKNCTKMQFAGANNSIYLVRQPDGLTNGKSAAELIELKVDKMPVGDYGESMIPFENREIELKEGDEVVLFTDGIVDQFGGPSNKKFKHKQLRNILLAETSNREQQILSTLNNWKHNLEQVDDICLIGVKIPEQSANL